MNEFYNKMDYFESVEKKSKEIYYHYTTLDALYSIVSSRTFRLTSLKSSNDRKELYYKTDDFFEDFNNMLCSEENENTRQCFELVKKSIDAHKEVFLKECKSKGHSYALCLSEKRDNLTHWDRYASGCTGVCIGFDVSSLLVLMQRMAITILGVGLYDIGKVLYSSEDRERFIKSVIVNLVNALGEREEVTPDNIRRIISSSGYVYAASACIQLKKFAKYASFIDEDEVRLYHDTSSIKGTLNLMQTMKLDLEPELYKNLHMHFLELVHKLSLEEEKFCVTSRGIRGYKELCLREIWGSGTIPEIILGPMCVQNKDELVRFLKANGLEGTKVSVSKVPIR